ncbi:DMT family transporter [Haloarchaeobius amylolyticus]|uniref:DMT family transporter n=1 Tax=Haloarchaeobius amylolyticus TaxID=1198296 RepID=A0ABD6BHI8_9EURY
MNSKKHIILFVVLGAIWGGAYPAISIGVETVPPIFYAAVRYDIASILMLTYVSLNINYWYPQNVGDWMNVAFGGLFIIGAYNAFLFAGQTIVPSAVAAVLVGLMPVFTSFISQILVPDKDISVLGIIGIMLGFVGIIFISRPDPSHLLGGDTVGQLLVIIAAASMALGSVLTERVDSDQPAITMEAWSMFLGAIVLHIAATQTTSSPWTIQWTSSAILMLVYLSVLSSAVAYLIYFYLLRELGAFEMNFVAYVAAAFGVIIGWAALQDQITAYTLVGFVCIFCGFLLLKKDQIKHVASIKRIESMARGKFP